MTTIKTDWVPGGTVDHTYLNSLGAQVNANTAASAVQQSGLTPTAVKTSGYTAAVGDLVPANATSGGFTVTLPSAPADKSVIEVKKTDSSTNVVTVQRSGSDVFNVASGATSLQLTVQDQTVALQYKATGAIWYVTGHGVPPAALDNRYTALHATQFLDVNGNTAINISPSSTAANYVQVGTSNAGGSAISLEAQGADADIDFYMKPKRFGAMRLTADTAAGAVPTMQSDGAATDIDFYLKTKGAGLPYFLTAAGVPYVVPGHAICRLDSAYTLTSTTSAQKLFNASTNGRVALPLGTYRFNCLYSLSAMSATSGNSAFSLVVGSATIGTILMQTVGVDGAIATAAAETGSMSATAALPASQHVAGTATEQQSWITGTFEVTTAGTIIPSITLVTAAAAVVAAGSFFECWRVGSTAVTTVGGWD